jgi:sirohydrochlorin ferrochelatase
VERTAILVLGHGSRRPRANQEFEALVDAFRRSHPDLDVGHAYIELAEPLLAEGLARLAARADRVILLPLFLFAAGHAKDDVPRALAASRVDFPGVKFEAARALGVHQAMVELALERVRTALAPAEARATVLLAVGRGSSDPDANGDFCKLVRLVGEAGQFALAEPSFIGITTPLFEASAERVALSAPERVLVLPYFLFDHGRLIERLAGQVRAFAGRHHGIDVRLAPHLGGDARLLALIDRRLEEALGSVASLPCDTCRRTGAVA